MRAIVFDGREVRLDKNRPSPTAAPGEAVIRMLKAGINGTDVAIAHSSSGFKGVLGHEFVGVVESGAPANLVNKRVVGQITTACGKCDMCQGGLGRHCRERTILGLHNRDGCLAERFSLPVANLTAVPDAVDDDHAVFAQPLSAAIQAAQQLTIVGKPYITVLGDGPLGLLMVQVMVKLNASVRLIGKHAEKLAVCEKWGIKHRHINDIGRRADQDIVVDCTGTAEGFALAMQLVHPRGKIVLKSMHFAPVAIDLSPIALNEIELIGSHAGPMGEALSMISRREVDVVSLISKRMKLDDGPAAIKAAENPANIKVLVEA